MDKDTAPGDDGHAVALADRLAPPFRDLPSRRRPSRWRRRRGAGRATAASRRPGPRPRRATTPGRHGNSAWGSPKGTTRQSLLGPVLLETPWDAGSQSSPNVGPVSNRPDSHCPVCAGPLAGWKPAPRSGDFTGRLETGPTATGRRQRVTATVGRSTCRYQGPTQYFRSLSSSRLFPPDDHDRRLAARSRSDRSGRVPDTASGQASEFVRPVGGHRGRVRPTPERRRGRTSCSSVVRAAPLREHQSARSAGCGAAGVIPAS